MLGPGEYAAGPDAFFSAGKVLLDVALRLLRRDGGLAGVRETGAIEVRLAALHWYENP